MRRFFKVSGLVLVVAFAGAQLVQPDRGPVRPHSWEPLRPAANDQVIQILDRSCRDCHTTATRWPLYSRIAPVSWFVADHVKEGRGELDFGSWASLDLNERRKIGKKVCGEVTKEHMPLPSYLYLHRDAKLSDADRQLLCEWGRNVR